MPIAAATTSREGSAPRVPPRAALRPGPAATERQRTAPDQLTRWLGVQSTTALRHAAALRPFRRDEFGSGPASPTDGHLEAANDLTGDLRRNVLAMSREIAQASRAAARAPDRATVARLLAAREAMLSWVRRAEDIWGFYLELFGQRQSRFGPMLLACDRIALDCYQYVYTGIGRAQPVPSPAPFCYMETGLGPATWRRGIAMAKLGRRPNPFPLIQLPHHRLVNPWTLGAVLHESGHNLQSDLGLWKAVPLAIAQRMLEAGLPPAIARIWARWHQESWADLVAVLLGGPEIVASLMDVSARSARSTQGFNAADVHPTPWLRIPMNIELLRRMGFEARAEGFRRAWDRLYPPPAPPGRIPSALLATFPKACAVAVDTIAFQPFPQLGGRSLAGSIRFEVRDQGMVEQAARRLAESRDPGIVPAMFLVGAARHAVDRRWAPPGTIARNFYRALTRR